jgi:hypothetical protein
MSCLKIARPSLDRWPIPRREPLKVETALAHRQTQLHGVIAECVEEAPTLVKNCFQSASGAGNRLRSGGLHAVILPQYGRDMQS